MHSIKKSFYEAYIAHIIQPNENIYEKKNNMIYLILFMITLFTISLSETLWFGIMKNFYLSKLENILCVSQEQFTPSFWASLSVWSIISIGQLIFVFPKICDTNLYESFLWGSLFGTIIYSTYNFTNSAILTNWPKKIIIVDILWGAFINGIIGLVLYKSNQIFAIKVYINQNL